MTAQDPIFGEVIYAYTRTQALEDGYLVDVSQTAREAGIRFPVAVTRTVWDGYIDREEIPGQDCKGRLWDLVWMFRHAIQQNRDGDTLHFQVLFAMEDSGDWEPHESVPDADTGLTRATHRLVTLVAQVGPGDNAEPVITIMQPGED